MGIEYVILDNSISKNELKEEFQRFFLDVFGRSLSDNDWQHQFIRSPYEESLLIIAKVENEIVGSSLMIPQRMLLAGVLIDYYLYTTSAVSKAYRSKGVYAQLLRLQRRSCSVMDKSFIFAFPNKLAHPVLKLFGGFKDLTRTRLVTAKLSDLKFPCSESSFSLDNEVLNWRFEHKDYKFLIYKGHVLVAKPAESLYQELGIDIDVLAIYPESAFKGLHIVLEDVVQDKRIITLECFLKKDAFTEEISMINATYFPVSNHFDYSKININLLMSDVF